MTFRNLTGVLGIAAVCLLAATILLPAACGAQTKTPAPAARATAANAASPTMATVDGVAITEDDLGIKADLLKIEQQLYELRSRAVENAVAKKLLEAARWALVRAPAWSVPRGR